MKTIETNIFGITVVLGEPNPERPGEYLGGTITSDLRLPCNHCGQSGCHHDCDGSQGADEEHEDDSSRDEFNAAIDGMERMILACACAGIDIQTPKFGYIIETVVDAIGNEYGK